MKTPKQHCREYIELAYSDPDNPEIVEDLPEDLEREITRAFHAGVECAFKVIEDLTKSNKRADIRVRELLDFRVLNAQTAVATTTPAADLTTTEADQEEYAKEQVSLLEPLHKCEVCGKEILPGEIIHHVEHSALGAVLYCSPECRAAKP